MTTGQGRLTDVAPSAPIPVGNLCNAGAGPRHSDIVTACVAPLTIAAMAQTRIQVSDRYEVSRGTYLERLFFDDDYNQALHAHLDFQSRTIRERREDADSLFLRIEYISNQKVPWAVKKVFGDAALSYVEDFNYDKAAYRLDTHLTPMVMANRIDSKGVMLFLEDGPGRCRRTYTIDVEVRVPVAGRAICERMKADVEASYAKVKAFTDRWIRDHELTGT